MAVVKKVRETHTIMKATQKYRDIYWIFIHEEGHVRIEKEKQIGRESTMYPILNRIFSE